MDNTARQQIPNLAFDEPHGYRHLCEVVSFNTVQDDAMTPGENFINEIEALERRYLAVNGTGMTGSTGEYSMRLSNRMATMDCR